VNILKSVAAGDGAECRSGIRKRNPGPAPGYAVGGDATAGGNAGGAHIAPRPVRPRSFSRGRASRLQEASEVGIDALRVRRES